MYAGVDLRNLRNRFGLIVPKKISVLDLSNQTSIRKSSDYVFSDELRELDYLISRDSVRKRNLGDLARDNDEIRFGIVPHYQNPHLIGPYLIDVNDEFRRKYLFGLIELPDESSSLPISYLNRNSKLEDTLFDMLRETRKVNKL